MPNVFPQELFDAWLDAAIGYVDDTPHSDLVYNQGKSRIRTRNFLIHSGLASVVMARTAVTNEGIADIEATSTMTNEGTSQIA